MCQLVKRISLNSSCISATLIPRLQVLFSHYSLQLFRTLARRLSSPRLPLHVQSCFSTARWPTRIGEKDRIHGVNGKERRVLSAGRH